MNYKEKAISWLLINLSEHKGNGLMMVRFMCCTFVDSMLFHKRVLQTACIINTTIEAVRTFLLGK